MSRYLSSRHAGLEPYVPGEQPKDKERYVKLNTNESPFPPSPKAVAAAAEAAKKMHLYSDPKSAVLNEKLASVYGIRAEEVASFNGSDEILSLAMSAFCDAEHPAYFPDITYSFYKTIAAMNCVPFYEIPLRPDFSIDVDDYIGLKGMIIIANPNAPTGILLPLCDVEKILRGNPDDVVILDEAYIDFGGQSALPLMKEYDNLLIARTFSKSRSMAGARIGFAMGSAPLIADLNTMRGSFNPYNVNSMTAAAAVGALEDEEYTRNACRQVIEVREDFTKELRSLGFELNDSKANFVLARHPKIPGGKLFQILHDDGFLVRHFDAPRLTDYNRISIGSRHQMELLVAELKKILEAYPNEKS